MNPVRSALVVVLVVVPTRAQDSRPDPGRYAGRVLDARFEPVAQAVIEVVPCDGSKPPRSARSDGAGEFLVTRLPLDTQMVVRVRALGLTEHRSVVMLWDNAPRTRSAEIVLFPAGRVTGRVVDTGGRPVAGARIAATLRAGYLDNVPRQATLPYWPGEATSDVDGRYVIERAPLGAVALQAWQTGYLLAERQVELHAEATEAELVLTRGEGARLEVHCAGFTASALQPLFLLLRGAAAEQTLLVPPLAVAADERGVLTFTGLPAGRYTLGTERWDLDLSPAQHELELQPGGTRTVEWAAAVREPAPTTGRLVGPDGKPLAGVRVVVQRPRGWPRSTAVTDGEGRFRAATPTQREAKLMVYLFDDAWDLDAEMGVLIADAVLDRPLELTATRRRRLEVAVVDGAGRGVRLASVTLFRGERGQSITNSWSDHDGRCQFREVDPGAGELCLDVTSRAGHAVVRGIELPRTEVLRVVIAPAAALAGTLRDAAGKPYPGARLLILRKDPEATALVAECVSDLLGRFRFPGLRGGLHVVQVFPHGGGTPKLEREVQVAEGRDQEGILLDLR